MVEIQGIFTFDELDNPSANNSANNSANSSFISEEDLALGARSGYDLDAPARIYIASFASPSKDLWITSTRDAMRICSHPKSKGANWMYCWTQHDIERNLRGQLKAHSIKDDGRLSTFEGLEDVKILHTFK